MGFSLYAMHCVENNPSAFNIIDINIINIRCFGRDDFFHKIHR